MDIEYEEIRTENVITRLNINTYEYGARGHGIGLTCPSFRSPHSMESRFTNNASLRRTPFFFLREREKGVVCFGCLVKKKKNKTKQKTEAKTRSSFLFFYSRNAGPAVAGNLY